MMPTGLNRKKIALTAVFLILIFAQGASAGVGGGIEVKETVDIVPLVKWTLVFLAGLGIVFGAGLAIAAKRVAVHIDPRVEKVKDVLAHAQCGACGYAGCEQYDEAVANTPDVSPPLCIPAGAKGAEAVALITGKKAEIKEPQFARIMCQGGTSKSRKKFKYESVMDCRAAVLAGGGDKSGDGVLGKWSGRVMGADRVRQLVVVAGMIATT